MMKNIMMKNVALKRLILKDQAITNVAMKNQAITNVAMKSLTGKNPTGKNMIWKKKENLFLLIMGLLMLAIGILSADRTAETLTREDFIRFHVIANSNTETDQALKLKVRDALLAQVAPDLQEMTSLSGTKAYLEQNLEQIETLAQEVIAQQGYDYEATASLGLRWIPQKTYGTVTFPAGTYQALTVELGAAQGENWWCVMFPPLCLIGEELTKEEQAEISVFIAQKYGSLMESNQTGKPLVLKFKTAEIIESGPAFLHLF